MDPTQWLEHFQHLSQISEIRVSNEDLVPDIMRALISEDIATGMISLPGMTSHHLEGVRKSKFMMEAVERFVATYKLAGHDILLSGREGIPLDDAYYRMSICRMYQCFFLRCCNF